jgi:hypothetical protein
MQTDIGSCSADQALQCSSVSSSSITQGNPLVLKGTMLTQARSFASAVTRTSVLHFPSHSFRLWRETEKRSCARIVQLCTTSPHPFEFIFLYKPTVNVHCFANTRTIFFLSYIPVSCAQFLRQRNALKLRNVEKHKLCS